MPVVLAQSAMTLIAAISPTIVGDGGPLSFGKTASETGRLGDPYPEHDLARHEASALRILLAERRSTGLSCFGSPIGLRRLPL